LPAPLAWIELIAGAMLTLIAVALMGYRRHWNVLYPLGFAALAIGGALNLCHIGDSTISGVCIAIGGFTFVRFGDWAAVKSSNAGEPAPARRRS